MVVIARRADHPVRSLMDCGLVDFDKLACLGRSWAEVEFELRVEERRMGKGRLVEERGGGIVVVTVSRPW